VGNISGVEIVYYDDINEDYLRKRQNTLESGSDIPFDSCRL